MAGARTRKQAAMVTADSQKEQEIAPTVNGDANVVSERDAGVKEETENIFLFVPNLIGQSISRHPTLYCCPVCRKDDDEITEC